MRARPARQRERTARHLRAPRAQPNPGPLALTVKGATILPSMPKLGRVPVPAVSVALTAKSSSPGGATKLGMWTEALKAALK